MQIFSTEDKIKQNILYYLQKNWTFLLLISNFYDTTLLKIKTHIINLDNSNNYMKAADGSPFNKYISGFFEIFSKYINLQK